ncbi:hypothetical protein DMENIID0001_129130 [Sergentomyia squamirostris]
MESGLADSGFVVSTSAQVKRKLSFKSIKLKSNFHTNASSTIDCDTSIMRIEPLLTPTHPSSVLILDTYCVWSSLSVSQVSHKKLPTLHLHRHLPFPLNLHPPPPPPKTPFPQFALNANGRNFHAKTLCEKNSFFPLTHAASHAENIRKFSRSKI